MIHATSYAAALSNPFERLNYRLVWDKKLRICLLTVITFLSLC